MDKLLAQTHLANTQNLFAIEERARDVYDLAMLALNKTVLSGHLGRDSIALLRASENVRRNRNGATRPDAAFASLSTFKEGTSEYQALERGYNAVLNDYVWGEKIPLNDAIRLALSLDPYEKNNDSVE